VEVVLGLVFCGLASSYVGLVVGLMLLFLGRSQVVGAISLMLVLGIGKLG
jgi:hypothetical protein